MNEINNEVKPVGNIELIIDYTDGTKEVLEYTNTILKTGRNALAQTLAKTAGSSNFYINRMIFGENGTNGGVPKFVQDSRNGLFGAAVLSKNVIASVDDSSPTTAIFTSVIGFSEANSIAINEMALQMASGDLYSMRTFPDLNKTSSMQITFNWKLSFV
jgi:hypothetical protein